MVKTQTLVDSAQDAPSSLEQVTQDAGADEASAQAPAPASACACNCDCNNSEHAAALAACSLPAFSPLPSDDVEIITAFFKALSDPTRFNILYALLQHKQLSVGDISQLTQMSMSAVSHQLAILRMRKLVKVTRDGVKNYYSLCDDHVSKVIELAIDHIHE